MSEDEAIAIARNFAEHESVRVGDVVNTRRREITRFDELWNAADPNTGVRFQWNILFNRLDDPHIDPSTTFVVVDDQTGRAIFGDNL